MVDPYDPEELIVCPYDPIHRVARKRMPYHILKCAKVNFYESRNNFFMFLFGLLESQYERVRDVSFQCATYIS